MRKTGVRIGFMWLAFATGASAAVLPHIGYVYPAGSLLGKVEVVLISCGSKGAVLVTKQGSWQGRLAGPRRKVFSTVACGDYLLAGFLKAVKDGSGPADALQTAIKVASARAWGQSSKTSWSQVSRKIEVKVDPV